MSRYVAQIGLIVSLLMISVSEVDAQGPTSFKAAVGKIGSESFAFGVELWALTEIRLLPEHDLRIEAVEVASESDRLKALSEGRVQFAILRGVVSASHAVDLRSIIAHRREGDSGQRARTPLQLVTRSDAPREIVYRIADMIFDHTTYISGNTTRAGIETLHHAMNGLSLPVHPGAIEFYEDQAETFSVMFGYEEEEALNSDEALQLQEACIAAAARGEAAHFIGYGKEAPCDATLLTPTESFIGRGGPIAIADYQAISDWQTQSSGSDSRTDASKHQPTM